MSIISEKGAGMAIKDVLPRLRRERGLTQEDLAKKLFITRQAVSRWETGETAPGIDMTKLIAVTLEVPVTELLEMPEHYCQSCAYTYETTMEDMIEDCAPRMAEAMDWTVDESASLLGAVLPTLKRWKESH